MSIIIKGMDIPKSCGTCFIGDRTICSKGCPLEEAEPIHRNPEDAYREDFGKESDHDI